jgi:putative ABC transport system permease protein
VQEDVTVIGVAKDFNYRSFHTPTLPSYFKLSPNTPLVTVNLDDVSANRTIDKLKESWAKFSPEEAFNLNYLKDVVEGQYQEDEAYKNAIQMLSIIALILASLGIFGVSSFATKKREKEFGIRKTLGAGSIELFTKNLFSYITIVVIGFCLCLLPSYYVIENWLQSYAYHIDVNYMNYGIALFSICLIIALVTLKSAYKLSHIDPIKVLRNE